MKEDMPTDAQIESEIIAKGKTAPRVTPADLQANIVSAHYFTAWQGAQRSFWDAAPDINEADGEAELDAYANNEPSFDGPLPLLTFCVLVLRNGFTVTGESACASPENFDPEIGRKIARRNAEQKIWPLMGYALKQDLHNASI